MSALYLLCTLALTAIALWQTFVVGHAKRLLGLQRALIADQGKTLTELHAECKRLTGRVA